MTDPGRRIFQLGRLQIEADFDLGLPAAESPRERERIRVRTGDGGRSEGEGMQLEYADYLLESAGTEVKIFPREPCDREGLVREFLDAVLPEVMAIRGGVVIHASAVWKKRQLVLLTGTSGSGKSTLSLALEQFGWTRFADDYAIIDSDLTVETFAGPARVWPDVIRSLALDPSTRTARGKLIVERDWVVRRSPISLVAVIAAAPAHSDAATIPLGPAEAFEHLIRACFRPPRCSDEVVERQIEVVSRLVDERKVIRLEVPHSPERLSSVASDLSEAIRNECRS